MLFVDSSHVSKAGSDLNHILFNILPRLNEGVILHFHDIFYPFEYPKTWVCGDSWHSWHEAYLLKAFLMYNNSFEIIFWNSCCAFQFPEQMHQYYQLYIKRESSSI